MINRISTMRYTSFGLVLLAFLTVQIGHAQVIDFTSTSQTDTEAVGFFTVTVQLDVAAGVDITVPFSLTGTATEGVADDYTIIATELTIVAGLTTGDIIVTVNDDASTESDETVIITLETPSSGSLGIDSVHTITIEDNDTPPAVTITGPADNSIFVQGANVDFTGTATDDEDGDLTDIISWTSDVDGDLGVGGAVSTTTLSEGVHTIIASVIDISLLTDADSITITITANTTPTVTITEPADTTVVEGTDITFTGTADDTEDGDLTASLSWDSDLDGNIGSGGTFNTTALTVGTHIITASVTDAGGLTGSAIVTVTITANTTPTVTITEPADTTVVEGTDITFTGTADDTEDGDLTASLSWDSDLDGNIGSGGTFNTTALTVGTHIITASVTDAGGLTGSAIVTVTITANTTPTVTITEPADTTVVEGTDITFTGTADDTEDGDLTASLSWDSDLDGNIGSGGTFNTTVLTVGTHIITASVTDAGGLTGSAIVTVTITANTTPTVTITEPADTTVVEGTDITFTGTADDTEDGDLTASLSWDSDLDGNIGSGGTFNTTALTVGTHIITASVTDAGGLTGSAIVTVTITANTTPTVTITEPADTTVVEGTDITFTGTADDTEDGDLTASLSWDSDLDGNIGSGGTFNTTVLTVGTHIITASVTDAGGLTGSAIVTVTITANTTPTVTITEPADTTVVEGTDITFTGTADDTEDGDLTASLSWDSDLDGNIGSGGTFNTTALTVGTHIITASVTDAGGLTGSAIVTVTITANTTPTVTITEPADTTVVEGTDITFTGTADDTEDGDLTASLSWDSDLDGNIGSGGTFNTTALTVGTHIITASVTDAGGLTGSAIVTVTITANTIPTATDVTISGTLEVGQILTGNYTFDDADGDLEGTSTFRWLRDGLEIVGATAVTYTLDVLDDGTMIIFEVTPVAATGASPGSAVQSPEVGPILPANTAPSATDVTITGTLEVGQELTGNYTFDDIDGDLEGASIFRWLRDGLEIVGATAVTYTLDILDEGDNIIFEVTPVAATGASPGTAVQSPEVGPILPENTAPTATNLAIAGILEVGEILTGSYTFDDLDGDLEGTSTFRWLRDDVEIVGATALTYTLDVADEGTIITFEVTPMALTGVLTGVAVVSAGVGPIGAANTVPTATLVTVSGTLEVGQILTGNYTFDDLDGDLEGTSTFRWLRDGVEIGGATAQTYTLDVLDDGTMIIFEVTPVAATGASPGSAVQSPEVGPILPANNVPSATDVTITGTLEVGQVLTGNYTFDDIEGDLEGASIFRWLRDGLEIVGATAVTYTLDILDEGDNIIFEVTPVAATGASPGTAVQSPEVGPILPTNTAPTATDVTITGTLEVGQVLTGNYTFTDLDGDLEGTSTFRWLRDGVEIAGATAQTYTLEVLDEGTIVSFEVTPVALTGVLTGNAVESPGVGPIGAANTVPAATGVTITGTLEVGQILTGNYTFDDADGDLEGTSTFRWLRDGVEISGATFQTYTLDVLDDGAMIIFEVTPVAATGASPGSAIQSPEAGPILPANTAPSATDVTITGTLEVGQVLTGNYTYTDADADLEGLSTFRWLRDGVAISGATALTYTLDVADDGTNIIFEVTPVAQSGVLIGTAVQSSSEGPVSPANTAPVATGLTITGVTEVGQVLTGSYTYTDTDGDLEGISTFRWLRDGVEIAGATALTYTLVTDDEGTIVTFEVVPVALTGVLTGTAVASAGVGPIGAANAVPTATDVTVSGIPEVGQVLTGDYTYTDADGDLEGVSTFRWLRDGVEIAGATALTYTLDVLDDGALIIFEVTPVALNGASPGSPVQSAEIGPIDPANEPPIATGLSIVGNLEVGQELTGVYTYSDADGDLEGTSTFRWLRDGVAIASATAQSYTLQSDDEGTNISFEVIPVALTGDSPGNPAQSAAVGPILPANTPPVANSVSITGNTEVGLLLSGSYTYSDADGDLEGISTFRWLRDNVAIAGATDLNYTLQTDDLGTTVVFEVTPVALTGVTTGIPALSAAVGPIGAANTIPSATEVTISGIPEVGQVLVGQYTFVDADGDLEGASTFRWLRDNTAIPGETGQTYTVAVVDLGATIIFEVIPVAQSGASPGSPVQSPAFGPVVAANSVPVVAAVSISGTLEIGQQLNGLYSYADADGDPEGNSTFRWLRDGNAIVGATSQSYRLVTEDLGTNIIFEVTPVALTGLSPGRPVQSASIGPVRDPDIEPISITPVLLPRTHQANSGGESYSIVVGGDIEVERVLFIFKSLTAPKDAWVTSDLTSDNNTYTITVTEEVYDEMGFEYEFVASDIEGNSANILGVTYIEYPDVGIDFESLEFGDKVSNYNLISVPLDLDDTSIASTFEDDLGAYDQTKWRLFAYNSTGVLEYQSGLTNLQRGEGYWLIVKEPTTLDTGIGSTELAGDTEFQLSLVQGWNLIGNPYPFNLAWDDVLGANPVIEGVDAQLTTYFNGYRESAVLNAMQGAFVFSERTVALTVPLEKDETIQGGRIHPPDQRKSNQNGEWEIEMALVTKEYSNVLGGLGMRDDAKEGKDQYDRIRPPRFLEYLDLNFPHDEFFATKFSRDIVPTRENYSWNFSVESNISDPTIELTWADIDNLPQEKQLWLYHQKDERIFDMRLSSTYSFSGNQENHFKIIYGDPEFVEEELLPNKALISAVYPVPFSDHLQVEFALGSNTQATVISVEVFDLSGNLIKVLWQNSYVPGFYQVQWDATSSNGSRVSPGVYVIRMNINGQKSIYRRVVKQ